MPSEREARASDASPLRFCELSSAGKVLVVTMRDVQFGRFEDLRVENGEPVFNPPPRLIKVRRIGSAEESNPSAPDDFFVKRAIADLLHELSGLGNGTVARLEFRRGLPVLLEVAIPARLARTGALKGEADDRHHN